MMNEVVLKKHSRLGVFHLWNEEEGKMMLDDSRVCSRTLDKLGIMYDSSLLQKIDGLNWFSSDRLSDEDYSMVNDYYRYLETKDESLRSSLNEAIERNASKQEEEWSGERALMLLELDNDSPARETWLKVLLDDDTVAPWYSLLYHKKAGEKYLL